MLACSPKNILLNSGHIIDFSGSSKFIACSKLSELGVLSLCVGLEVNSSDRTADALKSEKGPAYDKLFKSITKKKV